MCAMMAFLIAHSGRVQDDEREEPHKTAGPSLTDVTPRRAGGQAGSRTFCLGERSEYSE